MKLKGKRSQLGANYDESIGCFTDSYMIQCKGGGTTVTGPSKQQEAILRRQLALSRNMEGLGPMDFYRDETLAAQDRYSQEGLIRQAEAAGDVGGISDTATARFQDAMAYDPTQDPRTEQYLDAITSPLQEEFTEEVLPTLGSRAVSQGAFGGSRAAIEEDKAVRTFGRAMGDTRAKGLMDIIDSNRQQQATMMSAVPSLQDAATQESQVLRDVGSGYEGRSQLEIDADRERFEFGEQSPRDHLRDVSGMLGGIDFGNITKTKGGK
jgi:hypothetical protein